MLRIKNLLPLATAIGALALSSSALACTISNWGGAATGSPTPGDPFNDGIARYSGECAMEIDGTQAVMDLSPGGENEVIVRFYVLDNLTSSGNMMDIFVAYAEDAGTTPQLRVQYDGSNFNFITPGSSTSSSANVNGGGWNSVEFHWADSTVGDFWINADSAGAATGTVTPGTGSIESVRLGAPSGFNGNTGTLNFDAYEMHRSTAVGRVLCGDGNNDAAVNSGDFGVVANEFLGIAMGVGQPDCNEDGTINSGDFGCVANIFLGNTTCP